MPNVLSAVKVVEIAGLAPAPHCGLVLADFGADVVVVDRVSKDGSPIQPLDTLRRGKRSIALNLKSSQGKSVFLDLVRNADVVLEPFRPGKMEALGLGPDVLLKLNPRLIYGRMTGFGQGGCSQVSGMAGHDINYLAVAGILSTLAQSGENPVPPINLIGDFAGGGLSLALGVLLALLERHNSGLGQVIDAAMIDGANYVGKFVWDSYMQGVMKNGSMLGSGSGTNLLDGGAPFYRTYRCADDRFVAVGAIEFQFFKELVDGLGFSKEDAFKLRHKQMDRSKWPEMHTLFESKFSKQTRDEWAEIFMGRDACVTPVLSLQEATKFPHNQQRGIFLDGIDGAKEPCAAPKLSRTPGLCKAPAGGLVIPDAGENTNSILKELGFSKLQIQKLLDANVVGSTQDCDSKLHIKQDLSEHSSSKL